MAEANVIITSAKLIPNPVEVKNSLIISVGVEKLSKEQVYELDNGKLTISNSAPKAGENVTFTFVRNKSGNETKVMVTPAPVTEGSKWTNIAYVWNPSQDTVTGTYIFPSAGTYGILASVDNDTLWLSAIFITVK